MKRAHWPLYAVLVVTALTRLWLALVDDGIFWPDEIFQSIEPAHQSAFGYALLPWEYALGARSWLLPWLLAPLLRLGAAVGGDRPRAYLVLVRVVFVAVSVATVWSIYHLARKLRVPPARAAIGAALYALLPPAMLLGHRALSENASALPLVLAVALLCDEAPSRRAIIVSALLFGLSTVLRVQNGLVCVAAIGWLCARRQWRPAALFTGVLAACALADGALDRLTWGGWFQSARVLWHVNMVLGYARMMGRQPATFYVTALVSSSGALAIVLLALAAIGGWRARGVAAVALVYLVGYSAVGHKELRYALPAWPLLCALAAVGLDVLAGVRPRIGTAAATVALAAALLAAASVPRRTFEELGSPGGKARIIDHGGAYNRALAAAHDRADLCGLLLPTDRTGSGGISWLHRRVPVYGHDDAPPFAQRRYNYTIELGRDGSAALVPLGFATCAPDPAYRWRGN